LGYFFPVDHGVTFWVNAVILSIWIISVATVVLALIRLNSETKALSRLKEDSRSISDPDELGSLVRALPPKTFAHRRLEDLVTLRRAGDSIQPAFLVALSASELENEAALARWASGGVVLLGLGGTVWGLALSVREGQRLLGNVEGYSQAIGQVLATFSGLDVAFATTLAGVAAAITIGLSVSFLRRQQNHYVDNLDHLLHTRLAPRFQTSVGRSMALAATHLSEIQKDLDTSLRTVVDQLNLRGVALTASIDSSFNQLTSEFRQQTAQLNEAIVCRMDDILERHQEIAITVVSLLGTPSDDSPSLAGSVSALGHAVGGMEEAVRATEELIPSLQEALARGINQQTAHLEDSINQHSNRLAEGADRHERIVRDGFLKAIESLELMKAALRELFGQHTEMLDHSWAHGSRTQADRIGEQLSGHATQVAGLIEQQRQVVEQLSSSVGAMSEAATGLSSTGEKGQSAIDRLADTTRELIEVLKDGEEPVAEPPSQPTSSEEDPQKRQGLFQKWFGRGA
jgi:biopolymer transport protein ExbB/TolQ